MSRLIKANWTHPDKQEKRVIAIKIINYNEDKVDTPTDFDRHAVENEWILQQANEKAESIITEAESYAQSVKEQVEKEKEEWMEKREHYINEAKQKGFEEGLEAGHLQGYEEARSLIEDARKIVELSREDYQRKIQNSEQTILHLGLKVAEKILGNKLDENPDYFLSVVGRALNEAREYEEIQLHVNPCHYELLLSQKDELLKIFPREKELYIYPDAELAQNGCVIESANGRIDASVDQQLEEVKRKLFELLESE